ncbi:MAG: fatty acid desaturase [Gammaproteobacteria bacterium]|nr:fatty acid desaturase [Gammaproteobacteria bacterium]
MEYLSGLLQLGPLALTLITVLLCQATVACVTLYLHRDQAHRGLELHPAVRHLCRFWMWLTTGIKTNEWVAIHRKHHARCETEEDPHSPQIHGLRKVLFEGAELYREEAKNEETLEHFSHGTPDDWIERNIYQRHAYLGIGIMFTVNIVLFGPIGITIGAIQMATIPFLAAGIINGVGHHTGYRNFECDDAATNIVPWGVMLGGEELHNNHHAFPTSSKFSVRQWEFDIGWLYIIVLRFFGLAKVRKVAPKPVLQPERRNIDIETLKAVLVNRMHVLRDYSRSVTIPTLRLELADLPKRMARGARRLMVRQPKLLDDDARQRLSELLDRNQSLRTVHEFRERLRALWSGRTISNEKLVVQLREWVAQAEASGIRALQDFSGRISTYQIA